MADYKPRRSRKRAHGGVAGGEGATPPHSHMVIMIGLAKPKKKKAGGHVEGAAARKHLGKRARGGSAKRADGGATDLPVWAGGGGRNVNAGMVQRRLFDAPRNSATDHDVDAIYQGRANAIDEMGAEREKRGLFSGRNYGPGDSEARARGGRALDAREDANDPDEDGRDKVSEGSGTGERAVEMRARGGGTHAFRTPSGSVSANARREAEGHGESMKGGSFPIRNRSDLENAKHSVGRAKNPEAARRWINKRAKELGAPPLGGSESD